MPPSFIIEPAKASDAAAFIALRGRTRENAIPAARLACLGVTVESWASDIESGVLAGFTATRQGELVGYCFGDTKTGEVVVLALLPDAEGCGLGRQLLGRVVQQLCSCGHQKLFLGCARNPGVRSYGFYRHLGWQPTGAFDSNNDEILELHLASTQPPTGVANNVGQREAPRQGSQAARPL